MEHNWQVDEVNIDYMLNSGLLFEMNRQFLHHFGIAITVRVDEQGKKSWSFADHRDQPDRAVFDKNTLVAGRRKFEKFLQEFGFAQMEKRTAKMGLSTQYVECWVKGK